MNTREKILSDMANLATNALGAASDLQGEFKQNLNGWLDRLLAERDLVTREEYDVLLEIVRKMKEDIDKLKKNAK